MKPAMADRSGAVGRPYRLSSASRAQLIGVRVSRARCRRCRMTITSRRRRPACAPSLVAEGQCRTMARQLCKSGANRMIGSYHAPDAKSRMTDVGASQPLRAGAQMSAMGGGHCGRLSPVSRQIGGQPPSRLRLASERRFGRRQSKVCRGRKATLAADTSDKVRHHGRGVLLP
jgi:hypothetical protein